MMGLPCPPAPMWVKSGATGGEKGGGGGIYSPAPALLGCSLAEAQLLPAPAPRAVGLVDFRNSSPPLAFRPKSGNSFSRVLVPGCFTGPHWPLSLLTPLRCPLSQPPLAPWSMPSALCWGAGSRLPCTPQAPPSPVATHLRAQAL